MTRSGMLSHDTLDAVVVASPTTTHRALAVAALERGLGVLVETPMGSTIPTEHVEYVAIGDVLACAAKLVIGRNVPGRPPAPPVWYRGVGNGEAAARYA